MGFLFGSPSSISTSEVALGGLRIQSAGYGVAIPINYGKNRVPPTLIWYGNFKAIPHTTTQESGGKGGGGAESSNTTFTYTAGVIFSLGEGPVADIIKTWVDKQSHALPAEVGLSKFLGTYPQSPWGWLQAYAPGQALGYQGIVYVAASDYSVNGNASLGNHSFEVSGRLKDACNDDVNPKDIIVDFLTNANYGVPGFPASRIGDLTQLSNYCNAAGVRISPSVDTQRAAHEWLTEFAQMANSAPVWSEGKLKVLPYSDAIASSSFSSPGGNAVVISTVYTPTGGNTLNTPNYGTPFVWINSYNEAWVSVRLSGRPDTASTVWLVDIASGSVVQTYDWYPATPREPIGVMRNGDYLCGRPNGARQLCRVPRLGGSITALNFNGFGMPMRPQEDADGNLWDSLYGSGATSQICKFTNMSWQVLSPYGGTYTRTDYGIGPLGTITVHAIYMADNTFAVANRIYAYGASSGFWDKWAWMTISTGVWSAAVTVAGTAIQFIEWHAMYVGGGYVYATFLESGNAKVRQWTTEGVVVNTVTLGAVASIYGIRMALDNSGALWVSFQVGFGVGPYRRYRVRTSDMVVITTVASDATEYSTAVGGTSDGSLITTKSLTSVRKIQYQSDLECYATPVTYTPNVVASYNLSDDDYIASGDDPPIIATRKKQTTAFNLVQVEYRDRANDYNIAIAEVKDQASIEAYGVLPLPVLRLHAITTNAVAMQVAQAVLQRVCYVRKEYTFRLSLKYSRLEPMDGLTLTDARLGMSQFPVRVTEVSEDGDEVLSITAEERDLGISSANTYDAQGGGAGYAPDYSVVPGNVNPPDVFIAPANLTVSGYEVWAAVSNVDPNYGGCHIWASYDNATYQKIGTLIGNSRQGFITAALPAGADPDAINTLAVDLTESAGALDTANQPAVDAFDTLCLVGNEFVAYRDSALTAASKYNLTYLRRGVYGSTQGAVINARFVRCDQALFKYAFDPAFWGFTLYLKFVGFNPFGNGLQDIAALTPVTMVLSGNLTKPTPPSNFNIGQSGALVTFSWTPSPDPQVRGNEIRYVLQGAPMRWQDGIVLNGATAWAALTSSQVIPGAWSFMLAAEDARSNFSLPVTLDFTVTNANTVLHATQEALPGDTAGSTPTNVVKHWTGKIFPRSQNLASADGWNTFDIFVINPFATCAYEAAEIDLGSDRTVRAWAALWADTVPDTDLGIVQPQLMLDYKLAAGTYSGFRPWTINSLTARYVKMKFTFNTSQGTPVIRMFNPTIDA